MKQIILDYNVGARPALDVCVGKMIFLWGLYGYALAALWHWAGPNLWAQAATWAIASLAGLTLVSRLWEV